MAEIHILDMVTRLDLPPDRILEAAIGNMESIIVVGYDKDGKEYFASSIADGAQCLWLLERCKKRLLDIVDE